MRQLAVRLLVLPLAVLGVLTMQLSALAHYVYEGPRTLKKWGAYCTDGRSEASHGSQGVGYAKTDVHSRALNGGPCNVSWSQPAGRLAAQTTWYKWSGSSWYICYSSEYAFSTSQSSKLVKATNFTGSTPYCGDGFYGNTGHAFVLDGGGTWQGDGIWSGYHTLPA